MASHEIPPEMVIEELRLIFSQVRGETKNDASVKEMVDEVVKRIKDGFKAMREIVVALLKWILYCLKIVGNFVKKSCGWFEHFSDNFPESVKEKFAELKKHFDALDEEFIINLLSTPPQEISIWACLKLIFCQFVKLSAILKKFKGVMSEAMAVVRPRKLKEDPMGFLTDALAIVEAAEKMLLIIFFCLRMVGGSVFNSVCGEGFLQLWI